MVQVQHEVNIFEDRIKVDYQDVQSFKRELKEHRTMLKDIYDNDGEYSKLNEEMKEHKRKMKAVKDRIDEDPSVALLKAKIDDYKENLKDAQMSLFDHVEAYVTKTGIKTIDIGDQTKKIVPNYKLVNAED